MAVARARSKRRSGGCRAFGDFDALAWMLQQLTRPMMKEVYMKGGQGLPVYRRRQMQTGVASNTRCICRHPRRAHSWGRADTARWGRRRRPQCSRPCSCGCCVRASAPHCPQRHDLRPHPQSAGRADLLRGAAPITAMLWRLQSVLRCTNVALRCAKMARRCAKTASRCTNVAPRCASVAPRCANVAPQINPEAPPSRAGAFFGSRSGVNPV